MQIFHTYCIGIFTAAVNSDEVVFEILQYSLTRREASTV